MTVDATTPERLAMYNANRLKIGLFGINCSSGRAVTMVPERWSGSWPDNLKLARMADEAGVNARAPHPNAARLAVNFMLGKEAQQQLTTRGRVPTRRDVDTNPPGMLKPLLAKTLVPVVLGAEQEKRMDGLFKELVAGRAR